MKQRSGQRKPLIRKRKNGEFDGMIIVIMVMLILFGIVMITSASYYTTMTNELYGYDMFYFGKKQLQSAILSLIVCMVVAWAPENLYRNRKLITIAYFAICFLLFVTLLAPATKGQSRWLFGIQTSEPAKLIIILALARYITDHPHCMDTFKDFLRTCMVWGIPMVLILVANLSTAILVTMTAFTMMFLTSPKIWYFVVSVFGGAGMLALAMIPEKLRYRLSRIVTWLDPFSPDVDGYQTIQSLYAVSSGGLFGLGLGQSRQKTFLPESHNDFIFAIICEELGIIGAGFVILMFGLFVWRGAGIAIKAKDRFTMLTAAGITCSIGYQALINMAVATNTMPNTGQPLPFISYGGSSLMFTLIMVGLLLNISRSASSD